MTEPANSMGDSSSKAGAGPIDTIDPIMDVKGLRRRIQAAHSDVLSQWSGDNHNLGNDVDPDEEK